MIKLQQQEVQISPSAGVTVKLSCHLIPSDVFLHACVFFQLQLKSIIFPLRCTQPLNPPPVRFIIFNVLSQPPPFRKMHCVLDCTSFKERALGNAEKNVLFFDVEKKRRSKELMLACRQLSPALPPSQKNKKKHCSGFSCQDTNWGVKGSYEAGRRSRTCLVSQTSQKWLFWISFQSSFPASPASSMSTSLHICRRSL